MDKWKAFIDSTNGNVEYLLTPSFPKDQLEIMYQSNPRLKVFEVESLDQLQMYMLLMRK